MGQFRQFVVELLPQAPREKGEAFQQTLDVRVLSALPQEGGEGRVALGETLAKLTKGGQFALVVMVERHLANPSWRVFPALVLGGIGTGLLSDLHLSATIQLRGEAHLPTDTFDLQQAFDDERQDQRVVSVR
ncbi:hypothetical protein D9M68_545120 [compost metagenome]